jgi:hypothetical protein
MMENITVSSETIHTIRKMYHKQKTIKQICDAVNLTPKQLRNVLDTIDIYQESHTVIGKGPKLSDDDRERLRQMFQNKKSVIEIAASLGITTSGTYYNLRKMGLISGRWPKRAVCN